MLVLIVLIGFGCEEYASQTTPQVIVLGFDGLDPALVQELFDKNMLPNFKRLAEQGDFKPLRTSTPPHSPVAWSSIITGTDPGKHGIFDWIHRDPETYKPYTATTKTTTGSGLTLPLGKWALPLTGGGEVLNLRYGSPFWEYLTKNGVNAHVYRIPANYPPKESEGPGEFLTLTDMGTPDLTGSLGDFSFYTSGGSLRAGTMPGGTVHRIFIRPIGGNVARGKFYGPPDVLLDPTKVGSKLANKKIEKDFTIFRDKESNCAIIELDEKKILLKAGEWSDWQTVDFGMGPNVAGVSMQTFTGSMRIYLKQVQPTIEMYVSPIQVDPVSPALPISVPDDFAAEVAKSVGRYYSQGLPEDTKALSNKVLNREEFLQQAELIYQERLRLLDFALDRYESGFLFFYFGTTDQIGHMFWGAMADSHPALTPDEQATYKNVMRNLYARVDKVVGKVMERFPDATIICISDHGFANFARGFNVNTWLVNNGYATRLTEDLSAPLNFKWENTKAYAIGINALYINEKGRERDGIVEVNNKKDLLDEISAKLLLVRDEDGRRVIKEVYRASDVYSPDRLDIGPDLVIGYDLGFRSSWATALGESPETLIEDNTDAWCGDHCIATDLVPGVIIANRKIPLPKPTIEDIAPTILEAYGIPIPEAMNGSSVLKSERQKRTP